MQSKFICKETYVSFDSIGFTVKQLADEMEYHGYDVISYSVTAKPNEGNPLFDDTYLICMLGEEKDGA